LTEIDHTKLWTELYVEWVGIVKCNDRWSAIQNKRLDMWCGTGKRYISQIKPFIYLYKVKWVE